MTFTPIPPTIPGFYAWKMEETDKDSEIDLRKVYLEGGKLLDETTLETPEAVGGFWCRLIPASK